MKKIALAGLAAVLGAAALAIPASGAQSVVFHVDAISRGHHFNRAHNVVTFTNRLVKHRNHNRKVGHNRGRCRILSRTKAHCHIVYFFPNGKIKAQGRSFYRREHERQPVVGGTRAYNGVGGKILVSDALDRVTHLDFFLIK